MKPLFRSYTTEGMLSGLFKRRTKRLKRLVFVVAICLSVAYCGDTIAGPDGRSHTSRSQRLPPTPPLSLSSDSLLFNVMFDTTRLSVTATGRESTVPEHMVWSSLDTLIATVDSLGLVMAVDNGRTQILVTSGDFQDTAQVEVAQVAASVAITKERLVFLKLHEYQEPRAVIRDSGGYAMSVRNTWSSTDTDEEVIRVPSRCGGVKGLQYPCVRSLAEGSTQLIATYGDMADTIPVRVAIPRIFQVTSQADYSFSRPGESFQIDVEILDSAGKDIEHAPIVFTSSDPDVATVDSTGYVRVAGYGVSIITLNAGRMYASIYVAVYSPASAIRIDPSSTWLYGRGDTTQVGLFVKTVTGDEYPGYLDVAWTTTDTTIATFAEGSWGLLTAGAEGEAFVIARYGEGGSVFVDTAVVTVRYVDQITIHPSSIQLDAIGDTVHARVDAYHSGAKVPGDIRPAWSSGNEEIVSVDPNGLVTAVDRGLTTITAVAGQARSRADARVGSPPPTQPPPPTTSSRIEPASVTLDRPLLKQQFAVRLFEDEVEVTDAPVTWSVRDTMIAIINHAGILTSRRKGTTEVVAVANGETFTAQVEAFDPERDMLIELYNATGGPTWERNENWLSDQLIYEYPGWEGVVPWIPFESEQITPAGDFYASLDRTSHMRRLVEDFADEELQPTVMADISNIMALTENERFYDSVATISAGRVYSLELPVNNLKGTLPENFFEVVSTPFAVNLGLNEISGSLSSLAEVDDPIGIVIIEANRFTGRLPDVRYPLLFILGVNGNDLEGTPVIASPAMSLFALSQNEFTGSLDIVANPILTSADWSNTAGLCVPEGPDLRKWLADSPQAKILVGPFCNADGVLEVGGPFGVQMQWRRFPDFTAANDSIEIDVAILDKDRARITTAVDTPLVWNVFSLPAPGGDDVVSVVHHDKADGTTSTFVKSLWTGTARIEVEIKGSRLIDTTYIIGIDQQGVRDSFPTVDSMRVVTYLTPTVDQEVVAVDVPDVSISANTFGEWRFEPQDRNEQRAPVPLPVAVKSSDGTTVNALRNGVLQAGSSAGTATITVTLQDGTTGSGTATVTAHTVSSSAPAIDSIRTSSVSPADTVVLKGSSLDGATRVLVDGISLAPPSSCVLYEQNTLLYGTFVTMPPCPDPPPSWCDAHSAIDALLVASPALNPGGTLSTLLGPCEAATTFIAHDADSLSFEIPDSQEFYCTADRSIAIVILNDDDEGDTVTASFTSAGTSVSSTLAVGDTYATDELAPGSITAGEPTPVCLKLPESQTEKDYLITVHSAITPEGSDAVIGDDFINEYPIGVRVSADDGLAGAVAEDMPEGGEVQWAPGVQERIDLWDAHREAKEELRRRERSLPENSIPGLAASRAVAMPAIDSSTAVGDTVQLYHGFGSCEQGELITGVVKQRGEHVVMVADVANRNDYTDDDYEHFADILDDHILTALTDYFGDFSDVNGDERVTVFFTDEVRIALRGLLGWVTFLDLLEQSNCPGSNQMEMFYGRTPDDDISPAQLRDIVPALIAHELTHVIQSRVVVDETNPKDVEEATDVAMNAWTAESQAMLGEEVVAYAIQGDSPRMNYGVADIISQRAGFGEWYADPFRDLASYFVARASFRDAASGTGPCSWFISDPDPCGGRSLWYGVGWSFQRYINDQYHSTLAEESAYHTRLIDYGDGFFQFLEAETGEEIEDLLSDWNAMLYLDDHPHYDNTALSRYQMKSWKIREIVEFILRDEATIGPTPSPIPGSNGTLPTRNIRASSGIRYLMDTSGSHEGRSVLFDLDFDGFRRTVPLIFPIRVIRVK
ncbi:Ig-like domain-containing protein [Candidatus Palauibacter sp.]|uniref:Ig-like domain-containing protein n=1 Tax=Candidatus Palauibacter sp. TaxID=3101350 RepID=UPI003B012DA1